MNLLLAFLGWFIWNFALFSMEKDAADTNGNPFSAKSYAMKFWDNWILSLVFIPVLIIIGIKGIGLEAIPIGDFQSLKWSDAYYLGSGAFSEIAKHYITVLIKKYRG